MRGEGELLKIGDGCLFFDIRWVAALRPVYTGDFCGDLSGDFAAIFGAIPNRPSINGDFMAISWQLLGDFVANLRPVFSG